MAVENINIRVNSTSNMKPVVTGFQAMARSADAATLSISRMQAAWAAGNVDPKTAFGNIQAATQKYRTELRMAAEMSGQFTTATRNLTAATTDFNERLGRRKVKFEDIFNPKGLRMARAAFREQIALNNMVVKSFSQDAFGRISADIYTPKPEAIRGMRLFRQELGFASQVLRSVSEQTVNWGKNTQWAGRQLTVGFSVPISMAITGMSVLGYQLDQQLVRVSKVYGDAESQFQASDTAIRNMATETARYIAEQYGIMSKQTLDVMGELAATGREGQELAQMTNEVLRAAMLGDMSSDDSLRLLRTLQEAYRLTGDELTHFVNLFNEIENSTALTMQDITEGLPRIAGVMKSTGVSIEETIVLLTAFKEAGIDVAEGANALKSINFKAVAATPTAASHFFRITGVEMRDLISRTKGEFLPMMQEIANVMADLSQPQKTELIARVFGIHQGSRALTLLDQLAEGSVGMTRAWEAAAKTPEELARTAAGEIENIQESMSHRIRTLLATVVMDLQRLGTQALAVLLPIGEKIVELIGWVSRLPEPLQNLLMWGSMAVAAAGPFIMLLGQFGNLLGSIGKGFGVLGTLLTRFKILTPAAKAAEIVHEGLAKQQANAARAADAHSNALLRLTEVIRRMGNTMATSAMSSAVSSYGAQMVPGAYGLLTPGSVDGGDPNYAGRHRSNARRAVRPATNYQGRHRPPSTSIVPSGLAIGATHTVNAAGKATKATEEMGGAFRRAYKEAAGLSTTMDKVAATTQRASGAMMLLGMVTGGDLLVNIGLIGTLAGAAMPMIVNLSKRIAAAVTSTAAFAAASTAVQGRWGRLASYVTSRATGMVGALGRVAGMLSGAGGLAIAGAIGIVAYKWYEHNKQMQETIESYEAMVGNADKLADAYDFVNTSPIEVARQDENFDETSFRAQELRLEELREQEGSVYHDWKKHQEILKNETNATVRAIEQQNAAFQQGRIVLSRTGDTLKAQVAAWDAYRVIADRPITFEEFKIQFPNLIEFETLEATAKAAGEQFVETFDSAVESHLRAEGWEEGPAGSGMGLGSFASAIIFSEEDKAMFRTQFTSFLDSLAYLEDPQARQRVWDNRMSVEADILIDAWQTAMANKEIGKDTTLQEYLDSIEADQELQIDMKGRTNTLSREELDLLEVIIPLMEERYQLTQNLADSTWTLGDLVTGERQRAISLIDEELLKEEQLRMQKEVGAAKNSVERQKALEESDKNIDRLARQAVAQERLTLVQEQTGGVLIENNRLWGENTRQLITNQTAVENGIKAYERMREDQKAIGGAYHSAMKEAVSELGDFYMQQHEGRWEQERNDQRKEHEANIQGIEDRYERLGEIAEEDHEARMDALQAQRERDEEALDKRAEAMAERHELERERASEEQERLTEKLRDEQEERRRNVEETYDARILAVEEAIKAEERAEEQRQRMYEREKTRLQRLAQMFSSSADLNMAINSGDLDEAARIANEMSTVRNEWATDDAAEISQEGSDKRKAEMEARADTIKAEKDMRLEALRDIDDAEEKALREKFKRMDKELKKRQETERKMLDAERDALAESYKSREEALAERLKTEQDNLNDRKDAAITSAREVHEGEVKELQNTQQAERDHLETILEYYKASTPATLEELRILNDQMAADFDVYNQGIETANAEHTDRVMEDVKRKVRNANRELADAEFWEKIGETISMAMIEGGFGFGMSPEELRRFILTGELPENAGQSDAARRINEAGRGKIGGRTVLHTGGVVGMDPGGRNGVAGNYLSPTEVPAVLRVGEGVLNNRAMSRPGMREIVRNLNSGRISSFGPGIGDGMFGMAPMMLAGSISSRIMQTALLTGLERGLRLGQARMELGPEGTFADVNLSAEQMANAIRIINRGRSLGANQNDLIIAIMTAMQESSLRNIAHGDRDSLGLFQQRPSQGWGTPEQILNPDYAAGKFFTELFKIENRGSMARWQAAQAVQRSAFPYAYAKWEELARAIVTSGAGDVNPARSHAERMEALVKGITELRQHQDLTGIPAGGRFSGTGMGWERQWRIISNQFPDAVFGSGRRAGANTRSGVRSYHAEGRALDFVATPARMMEMFNWIRSKYGSSIHELYYSPAGGRQVLQGRPYNTYGTPAWADHFDHVHWAMKNGGWVPGQGFGDKTRALLEPQEFVVRRKAAQIHGPLLEAMNAGMTFEPDLGGLGHRRVATDIAQRVVDNVGGDEYNYIEIKFMKPVNTDVDFERGLENALARRDSRRGGTRTIRRQR